MHLRELIDCLTCRCSEVLWHVWKAICLHSLAEHLLYVLPVLGKVLYADVGGHRGQVQAVKGRAKVMHVWRGPALWVPR